MKHSTVFNSLSSILLLQHLVFVSYFYQIWASTEMIFSLKAPPKGVIEWEALLLYTIVYKAAQIEVFEQNIAKHRRNSDLYGFDESIKLISDSYSNAWSCKWFVVIQGNSNNRNIWSLIPKTFSDFSDFSYLIANSWVLTRKICMKSFSVVFYSYVVQYSLNFRISFLLCFCEIVSQGYKWINQTNLFKRRTMICQENANERRCIIIGGLYGIK